VRTYGGGLGKHACDGGAPVVVGVVEETEQRDVAPSQLVGLGRYGHHAHHARTCQPPAAHAVRSVIRQTNHSVNQSSNQSLRQPKPVVK